MAHEIKVLCVQQGFVSKPTTGMIALIIVTNSYVLVTLIGAYAKNHDFSKLENQPLKYFTWAILILVMAASLQHKVLKKMY